MHIPFSIPNDKCVGVKIEDLSEAVSWEKVKKQLEDYADLASIFDEVVRENAELMDTSEKFKLALEEQFTPYDSIIFH